MGLPRIGDITLRGRDWQKSCFHLPEELQVCALCEISGQVDYVIECRRRVTGAIVVCYCIEPEKTFPLTAQMQEGSTIQLDKEITL